MKGSQFSVYFGWFIAKFGYNLQKKTTYNGVSKMKAEVLSWSTQGHFHTGLTWLVLQADYPIHSKLKRMLNQGGTKQLRIHEAASVEGHLSKLYATGMHGYWFCQHSLWRSFVAWRAVKGVDWYTHCCLDLSWDFKPGRLGRRAQRRPTRWSRS